MLVTKGLMSQPKPVGMSRVGTGLMECCCLAIVLLFFEHSLSFGLGFR